MAANVGATVFNEAQLQLLHAMSFVKDEKTLVGMRQAISDYFAKKADEELNRLWDEGVINEETIEQWSKEHMRTPYK